MERKRGKCDGDLGELNNFKNAGPRTLLNLEKWLLLLRNQAFFSDLDTLRDKWGVPQDLEPYTDIQNIPVLDGEFIDSVWFHGFTTAIVNTRATEIETMLKKYNLFYSFFDLIQYIILYHKVPELAAAVTENALYDSDIVSNIIHDPTEAVRFPLTIHQKRFVRVVVRWRFGTKAGRPPKRHAHALKELEQIMSKGKNKSRRINLHTLLETLAAMEAKQKPFMEVDTFSESSEHYEKSSKKTYRDVTDELNPDLSFGATDRVAARLRQRVSRLKKRQNKNQN